MLRAAHREVEVDREHRVASRFHLENAAVAAGLVGGMDESH